MTLGNFVSFSPSASWYLIGIAVAIPDLLSKCNALYTWRLWDFSLKVPYSILLFIVAYIASSLLSRHREVAIRATMLGLVTGLGFRITIGGHPYQGLGLYLIFLSWFHFSEYYFTETYNPRKVKLSSFMLNHSLAYNIALTCSIIEFALEKYFCPGWKESTISHVVGAFLCVFGECIRKRAMCVAGPNFNHIVQSNLLNEPHDLITNDVYGLIQHPSYTGWFIFTIGTQVALCNPVCTVAFLPVMYRFFEVRVKDEEPALEFKYGEKYRLYKENTARFIPYVW